MTSRAWVQPMRCLLLPLALMAATHAVALEAPAPVSFELRALKSTYLVGEPVVIILTQRGSAQFHNESWMSLWRGGTRFRLLLDRGQGFTNYRRRRMDSGQGGDTDIKVTIEDGTTSEYVLAYDESIGDWPFPAPGRVRLMVEYEDEDLGIIRSNVLSLEITAPEGEEKAVYDALRAAPNRGSALFLALNPPEMSGLSAWEQELVERFPRSVYLQAARIRDLEARVASISDAIDPNDPTSPPPEDADESARLLRERRSRFLPEAETLAADLAGGQFEPDALLTLAGLYSAAGEDARSAETYVRLTREFPDRLAGLEAQERVEDDEPPEIYVRVSPTLLWPPNHKLVTVIADVVVNDDVDAEPVVTLVSITCDDGCALEKDVAGASIGTDDRVFELRAERSGSGKGRTYAVTYAATDSADNQTTASATVLVPHDQGKR